MLKDELFIRTPDGMVPTPRAEQLAAPVRRALSDMQLALEPETFVPHYAAVILAPRLVTEVISMAPGIRLDLRPTGLRDIPALLDRGELDLAIGTFEDAGEHFATAPLLADSFVIVMRRDHPAAQRKLTEEALAGLSYLEISSSGENSSFLDQWLSTRGLARKITHRAPRLSAAAILSRTDMVAVLSRRLAEHWVRSYGLWICSLPFAPPVIRTTMLWHRRFDDQPAHLWLRKLVQQIAESQ
jgi:DNA-binding transcriptional LysR family regulator